MILDASHFGLPRLGMYSWDLSQNSIIGDEVYADYLGFDAGKLRSGISVEDVIAQIADSDRQKAARSTHAAILSGKFSSIVFRINDRSLLAYGRCLRGGDGLPSIFCGALTEFTPEVQRLVSGSKLEVN